jgi:hypothetical protein
MEASSAGKLARMTTFTPTPQAAEKKGPLSGLRAPHLAFLLATQDSDDTVQVFAAVLTRCVAGTRLIDGQKEGAQRILVTLGAGLLDFG